MTPALSGPFKNALMKKSNPFDNPDRELHRLAESALDGLWAKFPSERRN